MTGHLIGAHCSHPWCACLARTIGLDCDCPPVYDHPRQLRPKLEWREMWMGSCLVLIGGFRLAAWEHNGAFEWNVTPIWFAGTAASLVEAQCAAEDALRAWVRPIAEALGDGGEP